VKPVPKALLWSVAALVLLGGAFGGGVYAARQKEPAAVTAPDQAAASSSTHEDALMAARTKGSPSAPITVLEVSDFQCPYCRMFWAETMPLLQREYIDPGKIRLVFVNLPLVQLHPNAAAAHEFAMCAALQNRFWPVHDMLFDQQTIWAKLDDPSPYFYSVANATGVAVDSLDACVGSGRVRDMIMQEAEGVVRAGVQSTPSFVIEGGLLAGAQPIEVWRPLLDSIYAAKTDSR